MWKQLADLMTIFGLALDIKNGQTLEELVVRISPETPNIST